MITVGRSKNEETIDALQRENLQMPRALIQDLLKMYSNMTEEQKKAFDEEVEKAKVQSITEEVELEQDKTTALNFKTQEEADEFLKSEGRLTEDFEAETAQDLSP